MKCIHGRSEKQKCRLCRMRSKCCDDHVQESAKFAGVYVCETCGKIGFAYEIEGVE